MTEAQLNYLEFINRLPLDKKGKISFVKAHVERLKQYEEETNENKENFNYVLNQLKNEHLPSVCVCCPEGEKKV
jgi:hypothetical protein